MAFVQRQKFQHEEKDNDGETSKDPEQQDEPEDSFSTSLDVALGVLNDESQSLLGFPELLPEFEMGLFYEQQAPDAPVLLDDPSTINQRGSLNLTDECNHNNNTNTTCSDTESENVPIEHLPQDLKDFADRSRKTKVSARHFLWFREQAEKAPSPRLVYRACFCREERSLDGFIVYGCDLPSYIDPRPCPKVWQGKSAARNASSHVLRKIDAYIKKARIPTTSLSSDPIRPSILSAPTLDSRHQGSLDPLPFPPPSVAFEDSVLGLKSADKSESRRPPQQFLSTWSLSSAPTCSSLSHRSSPISCYSDLSSYVSDLSYQNQLQDNDDAVSEFSDAPSKFNEEASQLDVPLGHISFKDRNASPADLPRVTDTVPRLVLQRLLADAACQSVIETLVGKDEELSRLMGMLDLSMQASSVAPGCLLVEGDLFLHVSGLLKEKILALGAKERDEVMSRLGRVGLIVVNEMIWPDSVLEKSTDSFNNMHESHDCEMIAPSHRAILSFTSCPQRGCGAAFSLSCLPHILNSLDLSLSSLSRCVSVPAIEPKYQWRSFSLQKEGGEHRDLVLHNLKPISTLLIQDQSFSTTYHMCLDLYLPHERLFGVHNSGLPLFLGSCIDNMRPCCFSLVLLEEYPGKENHNEMCVSEASQGLLFKGDLFDEFVHMVAA